MPEEQKDQTTIPEPEETGEKGVQQPARQGEIIPAGDIAQLGKLATSPFVDQISAIAESSPGRLGSPAVALMISAAFKASANEASALKEQLAKVENERDTFRNKSSSLSVENAVLHERLARQPLGKVAVAMGIGAAGFGFNIIDKPQLAPYGWGMIAIGVVIAIFGGISDRSSKGGR